MDVREVYSLPTIYYQIDKAINDPTTSNSQIADILLEDIGLSARLLKLANSAFYSFPSKVDTITAAISIIGTKQLRDLVLATSVIKLFDGIPEEFVKLEEFWAHSIGCGVVARIIAGMNKESNIESFFVAGVLHDIGSLLIYSKAPEQTIDIIKMMKKNKSTLHEAEKHCLGFTHTQVGGYLVKNWKLPKNLIESVYYHHNPVSSKFYANMASVIHIADIVSIAMSLGEGGEYYVPDFDERAWKQTGLDDNAFTQIVPKVTKQFSDTMKILVD